jgi:hypothetical protein
MFISTDNIVEGSDGKMNENMGAKEIDSNGIWHKYDGTKIDLLKNKLPVPEELNVASEEEYCLFLVPANEHIAVCPNCREKPSDDMILLVLETVRLMPAKCCDMMLWYIEKPEQLPEDYWVESD